MDHVVADNFIKTIEQSKIEFKLSICCQVDDLFASLVAQFKANNEKSVLRQFQTRSGLEVDLPILDGSTKIARTEQTNTKSSGKPSNGIIRPYDLNVVPNCLRDQNIKLLNHNTHQFNVPSTSFLQTTTQPNQITSHSSPLVVVKQEIPDNADQINQNTSTVNYAINDNDGPGTEETIGNWDCDSNCSCSECDYGQSDQEMVKQEINDNGNFNQTGQSEPQIDSSGERPQPELNITTNNGSKLPTTIKSRLNPKVNQHKQQRLNLTCHVNGCNQTFINRKDLKHHRFSEHQHQPSAKFVCLHLGCGRSFAYERGLARHQLDHTNVKPFFCKWPDCNYISTHRYMIRSHVR